MFPGAVKNGGGDCWHGDQPNWCGRGIVTGIKVVAGVAMVTGITGMVAVAVVTGIAQVAVVTGGEVTSPPSATDFAADLVVTAAVVVLAFPSPPEGSIVLWL